MSRCRWWCRSLNEGRGRRPRRTTETLTYLGQGVSPLNEGRGRRPRRTARLSLPSRQIHRSTKAEDVVLGEHPGPDAGPNRGRDRSTKAEDVVLGERAHVGTARTPAHRAALNEGRGRRPRRTATTLARDALTEIAQRRPRTSSSANPASRSRRSTSTTNAQRRPRTSSSANFGSISAAVGVALVAQRRPRTSSSANAIGTPVRPPGVDRSTKAEDVVLGELPEEVRFMCNQQSPLNEGRGRRPRRTLSGNGIPSTSSRAQRRPRTSSSANRR